MVGTVEGISQPSRRQQTWRFQRPISKGTFGIVVCREHRIWHESSSFIQLAASLISHWARAGAAFFILGLRCGRALGMRNMNRLRCSCSLSRLRRVTRAIQGHQDPVSRTVEASVDGCPFGFASCGESMFASSILGVRRPFVAGARSSRSALVVGGS